jgi:hypothetical protein
MAEIKVERKELMYATAGLGFILLWFLYVRELLAPYLLNMFPFIAMLIYNFGLFVGILGLSSILKSDKSKWKIVLIAFSVILGIGILTAPYLVNHDGTINTTADMYNVGADTGFASLWALIVPQSWVWFMTYIVSSTLTLLIIPVAIGSPKQIARVLG